MRPYLAPSHIHMQLEVLNIGGGGGYSPVSSAPLVWLAMDMRTCSSTYVYGAVCAFWPLNAAFAFLVLWLGSCNLMCFSRVVAPILSLLGF